MMMSPRLKRLSLRWAALSAVAFLNLSFHPVGAQPVEDTERRLSEIAKKAASDKISTYFIVGSKCSLLFIGTHHTFEPQAPLFKIIDADLDAFSPNLLIVEGGEWNDVGDAQRTIQRQGEMGYLSLRGRQRGIETIGFEPSDRYLGIAAGRLHGPEDVKLYMFLRMVPQWRDGKSEADLMAMATQYLAARAGDKTRPLSIQDVDEMVRKLFRLDSDWREFESSTKIHGVESSVLRSVDRSINGIRNANLFEAISRSMRQQKRVMVAVGYTHLAALVGELNELESICRP